MALTRGRCATSRWRKKAFSGFEARQRRRGPIRSRCNEIYKMQEDEKALDKGPLPCSPPVTLLQQKSMASGTADGLQSLDDWLWNSRHFFLPLLERCGERNGILGDVAFVPSSKSSLSSRPREEQGLASRRTWILAIFHRVKKVFFISMTMTKVESGNLIYRRRSYKKKWRSKSIII